MAVEPGPRRVLRVGADPRVAGSPAPRFAFCPACAAPRAGPPAVPFHCAACGFLYYFNPASAVAGLVLRDDGQALWIRRALDPARGKLAMPGGFVDIGERAEEALARELHEEVGARVASIEYLHSAPNTYPYREVAYAVLDLFYVVRLVDTDGLGAHDGVLALEWREPARVEPEELAFPSMRAALLAYLTRGGKG